MKNLTVKEKKITAYVFGKCDDKLKPIESDDKNAFLGKFSNDGYTRFVFGFNGQKFEQESREFFDIGKLNSKSYESEISINDL